MTLQLHEIGRTPQTAIESDILRRLFLAPAPACRPPEQSSKGKSVGARRLPSPGTWRRERAIVPLAGKTGPIPRGPAGRKRAITAKRGISGAAVAFAIFGLIGNPAAAQKSGGILRQYIIDSPASMSIHEETTVVAERPMMGVFNNLVIFDQHVAQNSLATVRPELATGWTWDEEGTRLDGQQYLQRLAHGGCLARSIAEHIRGRHTVADIHRATPREASVRRQKARQPGGERGSLGNANFQRI